VAEFLSPFVAAGAGSLSVIPVAGTSAEGVAAAGEVKRLLGGTDHR
jgi:hypothetical protein